MERVVQILPAMVSSGSPTLAAKAYLAKVQLVRSLIGKNFSAMR